MIGKRPAACAFSLLALAASQASGVEVPGTVNWQDNRYDARSQIIAPEPGDTDWPSFNRDLEGSRYSDLTEIAPDNVDRLEEACRVRLDSTGSMSSGLVLAGGAIYLTSARATMAIDPVNCDVIWKSVYVPAEREVLPHNRGVAYIDGMIIRGTADAHLLAYDARTGRALWERKVGDPTAGEMISAAPIGWKGKVFIGLAGGDYGIQGRMMAFDARTGRPLWTFNTIPSPGEPGNESWAGESWRTGGGGTWTSYSLDESTGELFVPVANPAPDLNRHMRLGDNLYTNSLVVLDAETGRLRWHVQTRPNDNHDYGVTVPPVLLSLDKRRMVAQGSKDGYLYMIDRARRRIVYRTAVTTILNHDADPTPKGVKICPGLAGGMEYNSPSYDPVSNLLIAGAVDWCAIIFTDAERSIYTRGKAWLGGRQLRNGVGSGWISAIDAPTGNIRWKIRTEAPVIAAIVSTAGGVTFTGDAGGKLYAIRTSDGYLLRTIETGGAMAGGIITYRVRGRQYLAATSGNISRSSWSSVGGSPSLIIYRLGDGPSAKPSPAAAADIGKPSPQVTAAATRPVPETQANAARGQAIYEMNCAACHGRDGEGMDGPKLQGIAARYSYEATMAFLRDPRAPMPRLYPDPLNDQGIADVATYIRSLL